MEKQKFIFYSDPGHAWLEVPVELVCRLGIADKIKQFFLSKWKICLFGRGRRCSQIFQSLRVTLWQIGI